MVKSSQFGLYCDCVIIVIIIVWSLAWLSNHHSLVFNRAEQKQCSGHADAQPDRTRERRTREAEEARIEKITKVQEKKNCQLACFAFHLQAVKCLGCMACLVKIVQLTPFFLSFSSISLLSANHYLCRRSVPWEAKKIYRNNLFFFHPIFLLSICI